MVVVPLSHGQVMMYRQEGTQGVPKPFLLMNSLYSCTWVKRWIFWGNKGGANPLPIATTQCNMHLMCRAMLTILFPLQLCPPPTCTLYGLFLAHRL